MGGDQENSKTVHFFLKGVIIPIRCSAFLASLLFLQLVSLARLSVPPPAPILIGPAPSDQVCCSHWPAKGSSQNQTGFLKYLVITGTVSVCGSEGNQGGRQIALIPKHTPNQDQHSLIHYEGMFKSTPYVRLISVKKQKRKAADRGNLKSFK